MLFCGMTIDEQRRIAKDMGRLAAWRGQIHIPPPFHREHDLFSAWVVGADEQCDVMSAAAAKIPLTWPDQTESGARVD